MEDGIGVLVDPKGHHSETLSDQEYETLKQTLATLRLGGWFASWVSLQVYTIAEAKRPAERYPSPKQIMSVLTLDAAEYETRLQTARDFAQQRPDLLAKVTLINDAEHDQGSEGAARRFRHSPRHR